MPSRAVEQQHPSSSNILGVKCLNKALSVQMKIWGTKANTVFAPELPVLLVIQQNKVSFLLLINTNDRISVGNSLT